MNYKNYTVQAGDHEVRMRVDLDKLTPQLANLINDFWSDYEGRLEEENDNVVHAVIRLFGVAAIQYFLRDGGASFCSSVQPFRRSRTADVLDDQHEGWPSLDDLGILITGADVHVPTYYEATLIAL